MFIAFAAGESECSCSNSFSKSLYKYIKKISWQVYNFHWRILHDFTMFLQRAECMAWDVSQNFYSSFGRWGTNCLA